MNLTPRRNARLVPFVVFGLAVTMTSPASAAVVAYDGFDYTAPGTLAGKAGGTGWNGAWSSTNTTDLGTGSLSYPSNVPVVPIGNKIADTSGGFISTRSLQTAFDPSVEGGVLYASLLIEKIGGANGLLDIDSDGTATNNGTIRTGVGSGGNFILGDGTGANTKSTAWNAAVGTTYLMVFKMVSHAGSTPDELFLKVYAPTDIVDFSDPASWTLSTAAVSTFAYSTAFDRIRLNATGQYEMDEIRIGSTWADVVPIPEPSTWGMMAVGITAFGCCGLARRRRSRRDSP